ncbi:MAG TPA: hypothetical protein VJ746_04675 [Nitrospira sp.]|nr:hypothetical protein [Nitrospira sp.]
MTTEEEAMLIAQLSRGVLPVSVMVLVGMFLGCSTAPSGHWEQAGRTEAETRDDFAHCEQVAFLDSQRNKTDEPFKGAQIEKNCMQRMGYTYVPNPK